MTVSENTPSGTVVTLTVPYQAQARELRDRVQGYMHTLALENTQRRLVHALDLVIREDFQRLERIEELPVTQ